MRSKTQKKLSTILSPATWCCFKFNNTPTVIVGWQKGKEISVAYQVQQLDIVSNLITRRLCYWGDEKRKEISVAYQVHQLDIVSNLIIRRLWQWVTKRKKNISSIPSALTWYCFKFNNTPTVIVGWQKRKRNISSIPSASTWYCFKFNNTPTVTVGDTKEKKYQ